MSSRKDRPAPPSESERREYWGRWRRIAELAVEVGARPDTVDAAEAEDIGDRASQARNVFSWPLALPEGGVFELLAVSLHRFARARKPKLRAALAPILAATGQVCLDLLDAAEEEHEAAHARRHRADVDG